MRRSIIPVLAACLFSAAVAGAAPFPTASDPPSASTDFQITHNYQQYATTTCASAGDCAIVFPATTAGTLILNASCNFQLATPAIIGAAMLGSQDFTGRDFIAPFIFSPGNYGINASTYQYYAKGHQPRIDVFSSGAGVQNLFCTVSGYYR